MGRIYHDNRNYITSSKPNGFEITGAGPIDDRLIVRTYENLTDSKTFAGTPNVAYDGMLVSVLDEGSTYMLIDKDSITNPNSWVKQSSEYIVEYTVSVSEQIHNNMIYPGYRYNFTLIAPTGITNPPLIAIPCMCIYSNHVNAFEFTVTSDVERQITVGCIKEDGSAVFVNKWLNNVGNTTNLITVLPNKKYMICVDVCKDTIIGMYCEI